MATQRKIFGRIPTYRGDWSEGVPVKEKFRFTYMGSEFQALRDGLTTSPLNENDELNEGWQTISNGTAAYRAGEKLAYFEESEVGPYIYAKVDSENRLLVGIDTDGNVFFGAGVPAQIKEYITPLIGSLEDKINSIDAILAEVDSGDWIKCVVDADNKIIEGIDDKGVKHIFVPCIANVQAANFSSATIEDFPYYEWIGMILDADGKIIQGIRGDGTTYIAKIDSPTIDDIYKAIKDIVIPKAFVAEISIANKITALVGDTLQIFKDSIISSTNLGVFEVQFEGSKGHSYPRYWEYTPSASDVGSTIITVKVMFYEDTGLCKASIVVQKTFTLETINVASPAFKKNVLMIGDSTIASGIYPTEVARRLCTTGGSPSGFGLKNIGIVGRLKKTIGDYQLGYEGFSGWTWNTYTAGAQKVIRFYVSGVNTLNFEATYRDANGSTYNFSEINVTEGSGNVRGVYNMQATYPTPPESGVLTKISGDGDSTVTYSRIEVEDFAPFIDNGEVTFVPYVNRFCEGKIDYLVTSLGINSIVGSDQEFPAIEAYVKPAIFTLLNALHRDFPSCKVLICTVQRGSRDGGFAYNFGSDYRADNNYYERKLSKLNELYMTIAKMDEYKDFVSIVDICAEFDAKWCYPYTFKHVNTRVSTQTEKLDTNFGHPTTEGYYLMADAITRELCNKFNN